jgi:hypothetical protein
VLRQKDVSLLAAPDLESRLLNGAGKRKRESPGEVLSESHIHGIQTRRSQFAGLTARQESNSGNGSRNSPQETLYRGIGDLIDRFLIQTG